MRVLAAHRRDSEPGNRHAGTAATAGRDSVAIICSRQYVRRPTGRRPPIHAAFEQGSLSMTRKLTGLDIARLAGVSQSTVSRVRGFTRELSRHRDAVQYRPSTLRFDIFTYENGYCAACELLDRHPAIDAPLLTATATAAIPIPLMTAAAASVTATLVSGGALCGCGDMPYSYAPVGCGSGRCTGTTATDPSRVFLFSIPLAAAAETIAKSPRKTLHTGEAICFSAPDN